MPQVSINGIKVQIMTIKYEKIATVLGKTAQLEVFVHLLNVKKDYLSGIAEATGLSHSSVSRVSEFLLDRGVLLESKIGKQIRMFEVNEDSPIVQTLKNSFEIISER
jgi:hypothetical protein